jgi:hypothetical protein
MTQSHSSELQECLESLRLEAPQTFRNLTLFPLTSARSDTPAYQMLDAAMARGEFIVQEISAAGSVPELLAVNRGAPPVLIVNGEELLGAKQNRVLNTTVLLGGHSETVIPVSCTEQGRWRPVSAQFSSSDAVMAQRARAHKLQSVSESLAADEAFHSDQGGVWRAIAHLQAKAQSHSPTGAMHDAFKACEAELNQCLDAFRPVPGQKGLLVLINGEVAGFDVVAGEDAYAKLHAKLVKSYAIEALLDEGQATDPTDAEAKARAFLQAAGEAKEQRFKSVGLGEDCRYHGERLAGSALVYEGRVLHAAFFRTEDRNPSSSMADLLRRPGMWT